MTAKVAIITISDNNNYGNRLQNYALQESINKLGYNTYTLWNLKQKVGIVRVLKDLVKKSLRLVENKNNMNVKRRKNFELFTSTYINNYKNTIRTGGEYKYLNKEFDIFVIGSDQIWNYNFRYKYFGNFEFAKFADYNKCFSYAASFGISNIPEEKMKIYKEGLSHIKYISVREEQGKELVKKIVNKDSIVTLDPTMLLSKELWIKIEKKPYFSLPKKFVLTYFLGGMSIQQKEYICNYANINGFDVISLNDKSDSLTYSFGPSEFVYLFHHTSLVFTDSFHACVFSILFNKPFLVFDRNNLNEINMNSRIETLLSLFNLSNRKIENIDQIYNPLEIDYTYACKKLNELREISLDFLKFALENCKKKDDWK